MPPTERGKCPSREKLLAFGVGRVPEDVLASISLHLETCQECLSTLTSLGDADDSLLSGLRESLSSEQFLQEPECRIAVAQFEAVGLDPGPIERRQKVPSRAVPTHLGRYRIIQEIGHGGMGTVYLALDGQLDRQVALKVPHFDPAQSPRLRERFYREARAAAAVEHPNLCPIYDVGEIDGLPFLSMAFIQGRSLSSLIKEKGRFSEGEAAEIVRKLAIALSTAHKRGVVHRDIKPGNIIVADTGEPILTDFGLARSLNRDETRLTQPGVLVGTPTYMAPEQVEADYEAIGPTCDIYSLGVVLYEMLTGRVPYRGPLLSVLSQIANAEPDARRPFARTWTSGWRPFA